MTEFGYEAELELKMPYFDAELTLESSKWRLCDLAVEFLLIAGR